MAPLIFGCLLVSSALAQVQVNPGFKELSLHGHISFLDDETSALDFQAILSSRVQERFTPLAGSLSRGYTGATSWLRVDFKNLAKVEQSVVLRLTPQMLDHLDVYVQQSASGNFSEHYLRHTLGDRTPAAETGQTYPLTGVPITLPPSEGLSIYIRIKTTSSHLLGAVLMPPEQFERDAVRTLIWVSAYQVLALALALITLIQGTRLRDLTHSLYALLPLGLGINSMGTEGMTAILLPGIAHQINDGLVGFSVMLSFCGLSLFSMRLFQTAVYHRVGHRFLQLISVLSVAAFLASGTDWYGRFAQPLMTLGLFFWVFLTWAAWRLIGRGERTLGWLFIAAFTLPLLGASIGLSRYLGWLPQSEFTQYIVPVTSLIHMVLMNLALSERLLETESRFREAIQQANFEAEHRHEQDQLLNMISHEIRTPIAVIDAATQSLQALDAAPDSERIIRYQRIQRSVDRLVLLLELASERHAGDNAEQITQPANIDAEKLTREIIGLLDQSLQLRFTVSTAPGGLTIHAEPRWLRFAWLNVIDNACKYAQQGTPICISIRPAERTGIAGIEWRIDDQGPGIVPGSEDKIFEKYYRGGEHENRPGLGLGLYLARAAVERQGGTLHALARHGGATFACWLPLKPKRMET